MGLAVAAGLAGISKQYLSLLERGERGFNRRGLLEDLAAAIGCSVADLTGQPYHLRDRETDATFAALPVLQIALNDYGPDDVPASRSGRWSNLFERRTRRTNTAPKLAIRQPVRTSVHC